MILFDHIEPPVTPDIPNRPPPPPPRPPAPAPDVVPVRDPLRPEHPDPVREPPGEKPPVAHRPHARMRRSRAAVRSVGLSMDEPRLLAGLKACG